MLSERSSTKKTFTPSSGRFHCKPAIAKISAISTTPRKINAAQRRHELICTSLFRNSQITHASAGAPNQRNCGCVN